MATFSRIASAIINTLAEFGPLSSMQLMEYLGEAGIGSTLNDLEADGMITRNSAGLWVDLVAYDPSYDEPSDNMTDVEADADTLASAGMGTDEDYGYFGDEY